MVDAVDIARGGRSQKPADDGGQHFYKAENEPDAKSLIETGFEHACALAEGGCECIGRHGHAEHENGNRIHRDTAAGTQQTSNPCARPGKHEPLAGLAKPDGRLYHSREG